MNLPPLLYQGSVKNVRGKASDDFLYFEYSDRYSIFDWGEMPDQISGKGQALNLMGYAFFKYLENEIGLRHHLLETVGELPSRIAKVKKIQVVRPLKISAEYNYQAYQVPMTDVLVPLEVIFRLGLAQGNSLSKRLKEKPELIQQFDLNEIPTEGEMLVTPIIDFSTKLENGDRYLTYQEARSISGMTEAEFSKLRVLTTQIAFKLQEFHAAMGLELWDGKVEFAFVKGVATAERDFMLVDSIGIDELRLIYQGQSLSKEFLREIYKDGEWYKALNLAKADSLNSDIDFRDICKTKYQQFPKPLSDFNKKKTEDLYMSYCNSVYQQMKLPLPFDTSLSVPNYLRTYL